MGGDELPDCGLLLEIGNPLLARRDRGKGRHPGHWVGSRLSGRATDRRRGRCLFDRVC